MNALEVVGLRKSFNDRDGEVIDVFNGISFDIPLGQIVGIFGPSGCGKSTLLRIVSGVESYEGRVLVLGQNANEHRGSVAYVPQRSELLYWRTLFSNSILASTLRSSVLRKTNHKVIAKAHELFDVLRLRNVKNKYPLQCSGGEKQRVAIIRALLTNHAHILALDEPVSGIDYIARSEIFTILSEIIREELMARAVLIVSHDPEDLMFLCNRIIVIPKLGAPNLIDMQIPFTYPRDRDVRFTSDFVNKKKELWGLIR